MIVAINNDERAQYLMKKFKEQVAKTQSIRDDSSSDSDESGEEYGGDVYKIAFKKLDKKPM